MRKAAILLLLFLLSPIARADLRPENLLLVVNANIPESRALAEFYAKARLVPDGRILALPLTPGDDIPATIFESQVVPAVQGFLHDNHLEQQVTCIVTFFGVPLRIAQHVLSPQETREIESLKQDQARLITELRGTISSLESDLKKADPQFTPPAGDDVSHLILRAQLALKTTYEQAARLTDPQQRAQRLNAFSRALDELAGQAGLVRWSNQSENPQATPQQKAESEKQLAQIRDAVAEIKHLQERRFDPDARALLRKLIAQRFGKLDLLLTIDAHLAYLNPTDSVASFDNELARLWFPAYARQRWQLNPMHYKAPHSPNEPPLVMVMRLDAPQSGIVRDMILASLKAERDGLKGRLVLDSRGISAAGKAGEFGSYGWYDQSIRNLAKLAAQKTKLQVLHEDSPQLLPPDSASGVALYCGWYSVRNYVPSCKFVPGAIGFHVASFELLSLRAQGEKGWCRGLLDDGVAATLGPVSEPFLAAFPAADDFFPLLLTGKLPLAEVYWKTSPFTSWMISMIGDPLYTPYKTNPALKVEDLPDRLKPILEPPATQPR